MKVVGTKMLQKKIVVQILNKSSILSKSVLNINLYFYVYKFIQLLPVQNKLCNLGKYLHLAFKKGMDKKLVKKLF